MLLQRQTTPDDFDSGDESGGNTALDKVIDAALKRSKRGPKNKSIPHYHTPTPIVHASEKLWQFKCRYCTAIWCFPRTVDGPDITFDTHQKPRPKLQNLATHLSECTEKVAAEKKAKKAVDAAIAAAAAGDGSGAHPVINDMDNEVHGGSWNLRESARMLEEFLTTEGELNPQVIPVTQEGFVRLFAAWILDESLPWTTGEAPSLVALFKYLKINFYLPSDTTVRNYLTRIFIELHEKVVRELAVRSHLYCKVSRLVLTNVLEREVEDCLFD
jgi:hypothetical protein